MQFEMSSLSSNNPELEITVLDNGIHVYKLRDWSYQGLEQWETSIRGRLDKATGKTMSIYDMRGMDTISRRGFEVANRLETHPNTDLFFSAALVNSRRVSILVNTLIQMRRNSGRSRIFSEFDDAVEWLLEQ